MAITGVNINFPRYSPRYKTYDNGNARTVRSFCPFCGKQTTERTFLLEKPDPADRTDEEQAAYEAMAHRDAKTDGDIFMDHLMTAHPRD